MRSVTGAGGHADLRGDGAIVPPALLGLWRSAQPATLHDGSGRVVAANEAFCALAGVAREALIGRDALQLAGEGGLEPAATGPAAPLRRCVVDAQGRERWFALSLAPMTGGGVARWLGLAHDVGAEHAARLEAQRAGDELAQWLELPDLGMLVYDESGLVLRANRALEALLEQAPVLLPDAAPEIRELFGWTARGPLPQLAPGGVPIERQALLTRADGQRRRLGARLAARMGEDGHLRILAVVRDHSAEEERDLARLEMGMLMDAASIGVATFDPGRGWLMPSATGPAQAPAPAPGDRPRGGLQGIGRELVEPDSLPEYERLQRALKKGERAEVRYAVRHPELGQRWLLTRIEPGVLAAGRPTTSVVTLDITDREQAQRRNEQLLRELGTILDGSTAGIAYLRGRLLVRANQRFERMLGLAAGAAAGASLEEVLGADPQRAVVAAKALAAIESGQPFETELVRATVDGGTLWYALSVRRAEPVRDPPDAVAVLTDITRLKLQQAELERLLRERELMFSLSDVGIVYQRGARIERANQAMAQLTGYAAPELMQLDPAALHEDARACVAFEAQVAQALRQQGRFSGERRLRRRDGTLRWVQVAVRPVDADDAEAGTISSFVDVDERHRARESLAEQAARTRAVLNSVLVGIVTVSEQRGIEWMNRSARRMFGGELADFVGEPIAIVATPEPDHPLRRGDYLERLGEGQAETFECQLKARDGREFWVVGNAVVTGRERGRRQLTFALLDIERRRQAEISIAQAQSSLQRVLETAPLAIALFDARTRRVLQLNQMASAFFGQPAESLVGRPVDECGPPARAAQLADWLREAAAGGTETLRRELRTGDAEAAEAARVWDARIVALAPLGAEAAQLLLVASDVTEQRAAEQARLQAAIAQREVLVREVHHRIKNNLQGVAGLLQHNAARHPEVAVVLSEAVGQVQAIAQVYGLQVGSSGPLGVAPVVSAIAQSVARTFGRTIRCEVEPGLGQVLPEAESIPVALTVNELLTNAVKHGAEGDVTCTLRSEGDAIVLEIVNRGALPEGFDLARFPGGVSGLGLVRALLPRRGAQLAISETGGEVHTRVVLRPPSVRPPAA